MKFHEISDFSEIHASRSLEGSPGGPGGSHGGPKGVPRGVMGGYQGVPGRGCQTDALFFSGCRQRARACQVPDCRSTSPHPHKMRAHAAQWFVRQPTKMAAEAENLGLGRRSKGGNGAGSDQIAPDRTRSHWIAWIAHSFYEKDRSRHSCRCSSHATFQEIL